MEIIVRKAKEADIAQMVRLYIQGFAGSPWCESWTYGEAERVVRNPLLSWWVATTHKEFVVGMLAGCVGDYANQQRVFSLPILPTISRSAYLAELVVHPHFRGKGVARRLTNTFLPFSAAHCGTCLLVRTRPGTGNYPWYKKQLHTYHTYPDGRVLFGRCPLPQSL